MDMQGSDHAPVHADWDLLAPLPTPETAPPLSTRYMFTGTLHCVKLGMGLGFFSSRKCCRLFVSSALCWLSLPASGLFPVGLPSSWPLPAVKLPL